MMTDEFESRLRRVLKDEAYRLPIRPEARSLLEREARPRPSWIGFAAATIAAVAVIVAVVAVVTGVGRPPTAASPPADACSPDEPVIHGSWWDEIGGENAFFHLQNELPASRYRYLVIVRFDPNLSADQEPVIWAERLSDGRRVDGSYNSRIRSRGVARFDEPIPRLPGGLFLFEQAFSASGCWRVSAAVDGNIAGSATIRVTGEPPSLPELPLGRFVTLRPVGESLCFEFETSDPEDRLSFDIPLRWWNPSDSDDCLSPMSDLVTSTGTLAVYGEGQGKWAIRFAVPQMDGGSREFRVILEPDGSSLRGWQEGATDQVLFLRTDPGEPTTPPV